MWMPVTATACTVTQAPALRPPNDLSHEVPPQAGPTLPGIPALVDIDKVLQTRSKAVPRLRATDFYYPPLFYYSQAGLGTRYTQGRE